MKYSQTTGCFYPDWGKYESLPDDVIEVPNEEAEAAIARLEGTMINVVGGKISIVPIPPRPIAEQRAEMWERIKAERLARGDGGIKVGDLWFHSDDKSVGQHLGLTLAAMQVLQAGGTTATVINPTPWKTMSGEKVPLTAGLAFQIFKAGANFIGQLHVVAETHKAAMEASSDPLSYNYLTGWPERYGDGL